MKILIWLTHQVWGIFFGIEKWKFCWKWKILNSLSLRNSVWWIAWRIAVNVSHFTWNKVLWKRQIWQIIYNISTLKIRVLYSSCQAETIVEAFIIIAWDKFLRTFTRVAFQKIISLTKFWFNWIAIIRKYSCWAECSGLYFYCI